MGPLYFQTQRNVHTCGVRSNGEPKQFNFLINEDETIGTDGSNIHGPAACWTGYRKITIPVKYHAKSMLITAVVRIKTNISSDILCGELCLSNIIE